MQLKYISDIQTELNFVCEAAEHFAKYPEHSTYTNNTIKPGCFLALRWGLGNDCIAIIKLDKTHLPTIYMEVIN